MDINIVKSFGCSKFLPFNYKGYTYSTDGRIAIKIKELKEFSDNNVIDRIDYLEEIFTNAEKIISENNISFDIPNDLEYTKPCSSCNGTGFSTECEECDGDGSVHWTSDSDNDYSDTCAVCHGNGKTSDNATECSECSGKKTIVVYNKIKINNVLLSGELLKKLKILAIKLYPYSNHLAPVPFKFDDGVGIIMPIRKSI